MKDPVAVAADRLAEPDERVEAAAGGFADEPVDQHGDVLDGQAGCEDSSQRFLEGVGAPDRAAGGLQSLERGGLLLVEVVRVLEQRPAGGFEPASGGLLAGVPELVPVVAADLVQRPVGERYDVIRVDRDDRVRGGERALLA